MSEKNVINFNLVKSILFGLIFPFVFCWFFFEANNFKPIEKDFGLIVQKKIETKAIVTKGKWFEDVVESYNDRYVNVDGYEYSYTFYSNKGERITTESFTYGELPNDKQISQIPFQVNVEYLVDDPKTNRIVGLPENNESLWDFLRNRLLLPLLYFALCCYFSFIFIKPAIVKYRIETKRNKEKLKMAEIKDFINQTYLNNENQENNKYGESNQCQMNKDNENAQKGKPLTRGQRSLLKVIKERKEKES
jgi:hypothetical protein